MGKELLICKSTNQMLRASHLLEKAGIEIEMVPTPAIYGDICSTALKFNTNSLDRVKEILLVNNIDYKGIHSEKIYTFSNLLNDEEEDILPIEFIKIIGNISTGKDLRKQEIIYLLGLNDEICINKLFDIGNKVRKEIIGDIIDVRGAVEFSNYCSCSCMYCGLRKENQQLKRYRMSEDEIIQAAEVVAKMGLKTIILQSGEDEWYTTERLIKIVREIKSNYNLRITLSIGERPLSDYYKLKEAGGNNFLLKIECSNPYLYKKIHPHGNYANRVECIRTLKKAGFRAGSGNIIGLPGQTLEDLTDDILFYKREGIHMIGIGPFVPALNTPLSNYPIGDIIMTLKSIAVTRIVLKNVYLPATTALASVNTDAYIKALQVGANTIMLVNTPERYQNLYHIYKDKRAVDLDWTLKIIDDLGRKRPLFLQKSKTKKGI